jgi:hypothetical protein
VVQLGGYAYRDLLRVPLAARTQGWGALTAGTP